MTESLINDGVVEVLKDFLHSPSADPEDGTLQAALWQTLAGIDAAAEELEYLRSQIGAVRWIVKPT